MQDKKSDDENVPEAVAFFEGRKKRADIDAALDIMTCTRGETPLEGDALE
jgi:hypothetical protein